MNSKTSVTLLFSPTTAPTWYPCASRLLTESLLGSRGLDVSFSSAPIEVFVESYRAHRRQCHAGRTRSTLDVYAQSPMTCAPHLDVLAGRFDALVLASVPTDVVLLSASTIYDLAVIPGLLAAGKRVVLGGNLTLLYSAEELRRLLMGLGVDRERVQKALSVVAGHVDAATDLTPYVTAGVDATLPSPSPAAWFVPGPDFLLEHASTLEMMLESTTLALPLSTGCWYGECEFCTVRRQPKVDFTVGLPPAYVSESLHRLAETYRTHSLVLTDNYLRLTESTRAVLSDRRPLEVTAYSGVRLLKDADYVRDLNAHVDGLRVGIESGSDFALEATKKGYTYADIERAAHNLIAHFDKDKELTLLIVFDLPYADLADVQRSFARLVELKERLRTAGFADVPVAGFPFIAFPGADLLGASSHFEAQPGAMLSDEELCGVWTVHRWYERATGRRLPPELETLIRPYRRRDAAGTVLPNDFTLLEPAMVQTLLGRHDVRGLS